MTKIKLQQINLDQTGAAFIKMEGGLTKIVPLYSLKPCFEAQGLLKVIPGAKYISNVFYTNNLMDYKIEDVISDYEKEYGHLPETLMDEMVSGFPFIKGLNTINSIGLYA